MKVLFALSDDDVSEQIVKRYRKEYKEIISYKNVYYFNAIVKEIQKDKTYDRIVISEDLEQYVTNNINQIDKTIFEKLDAITDEATDTKGKEIPIIFICSNTRKKSDYFAVKLFSLGIYNALIGNDREVSEVCQLLKKPRSKKDAKLYYKIDSEEVTYESESENDVNEVEIQNILAHYKKIGNDEKKCIVSFDDIASQYNDQQLKLIIKCLPLSVRAILEEKSDKYKSIVLEAPSLKLSNSEVMKGKGKDKENVSRTVQSLLGSQEQGIKKEVIIPTNINLKNAKKIDEIKQEVTEPIIEEIEEVEGIEEQAEHAIADFTDDAIDENVIEEPQDEFIDFTNEEVEEPKQEELIIEENTESQKEKKAKSKKEKPKKEKPKKEKKEKAKKEPVVELEEVVDLTSEEPEEEPVVELEEVVDLTSEGPEEEPAVELEEVVDLTSEEPEEESVVELEEVVDLTSEEPEEEPEAKLQIEEKKSRYSKRKKEKEQEIIEDKTVVEETAVENQIIEELPETEQEYQIQDIEEQLPVAEEISEGTKTLDELFTDAEIYASDKKIVAFVGAHQAGTSFLINSLAELLQSKGVNTAILDLTKNRNSYYIYTKNDEDLRNIAMNTRDNLLNDRNAGIKVRRNLFVYTSLPEDEVDEKDIKLMLKKLISKHYLILIDCDLDTPINCFGYANEVYLVQNMDILTIQPLTDFLEKLKKANILNDKKFNIIINKAISVRGLSPKMIISGMSYHSDSKMSETKELFNRNEINRTIIPFDEKTYSKYLESMVDCDINIVGYSKKFMKSLKQVALKICPHIKLK